MGGIAGSVAPVFRDEGYVATATYDFYHAIIHNNKLYFCRQDGVIGHEPQETSDEYWFLSLDGTFADAASLGGETAAQWQSKLDNIQTTSRAILSQAGWYRVAEYNGSKNGEMTNSCELNVKMSQTNTGGESFVVALSSAKNNQTFNVLRSHGNGHSITKIRYVYNSAVAYLEVYYAVSVSNYLSFEISSPRDTGKNAIAWKAITPTLTAETVDGVTVTCEYDIPANATPVTNLDLNSAMESHIYSQNRVNNQEELDTYLEELHNSVPDGTYYRRYIFLGFSSSRLPIGSGLRLIEGYRQGQNNGYQKIIGWNADDGNSIKAYEFLRGRTANTWGDWGRITTSTDLTAALEGYLPLNGGKLTGALEFDRNAGSLDRIFQSLDKKFYLRHYTDATNLNKFTEIRIEDGKAYLGVDANDGAGTVSKVLLHSGNYTDYTVYKGTSAPSSTTCIWVDTANKVIKAYIDGAWTQVS